MTTTGPGPRRFALLGAFRGKYGRLLLALIVLLASSPMIARGRGWSALLSVASGGVLLTSVYATNPRRRNLVIGLVLAVADLMTNDQVHFRGVMELLPARYLVMLIILLYAAVTILEDVLGAAVVTLGTLQAAVCAYMLLGLAWSLVYAMIDLASPGSIQYSHLPPAGSNLAIVLRDRHQQLIYFSYATLTTVGYGDVVPINGFAQTAAVLEAIVGQVYLAVLIGRLVGLHITQAPPR